MKRKEFLKLNKIIIENSDYYLVNGKDVDNGSVIIRMLDKMEKDGWMVDLRIALDQGESGTYLRMPGTYEAFICYDQEKMNAFFVEGKSYPKQDHYGKFRWEAIAKAFTEIYEN